MGNNGIIIIGSSNIDMVVKTNKIPVPGETVLGGEFYMNPGGKGANQAVAVARLGGKVLFISKIGDDIFGKQARQLFRDEGIDTQGLIPDEQSPSGVALITVDDLGENSIVVAPGANMNLTGKDIDRVFKEKINGEILLMQMEIPVDTVKHAAKMAKKAGIKVILNPAPANLRVKELFPYIDVITPNTTETEILTGIKVIDLESGERALLDIHHQGVENVIITMGRQGALVLDSGEIIHVPAEEVKTVDTTGAGDAFNGALAVGLSEGKSIEAAVRFANRAAAVTVQKLGAQSTMPYREEVILRITE